MTVSVPQHDNICITAQCVALSLTSSLSVLPSALYNHVFDYVVNLSSSLLVNLSSPFHTQCRYYHLSPINLLMCGMFPTDSFFFFLEHQPFIAPVQTCLKSAAGITFRRINEVQHSILCLLSLYCFQ